MRKIIVYKRYFLNFYEKQPKSVQLKIQWTLGLIQDLRVIPKKYLKFVKGTDGLFEIRVYIMNKAIRIFCFFDKNQLVILGNGFIKKNMKLPKREVSRALRIKKEYFDEKE